MMKPAPPDPPEISPVLWQGIGGNTGWDIGANCGQTLYQMTARFQQVVAFEPAEECQPFLDNAAGVFIVPMAVSDHDGYVDLLAAPGKIDTGQLATPIVTPLDWNPHDGGTRIVACHTIDSLADDLGPPDFCKVDVEGHEAHVLAGAVDTIEQHQPNWLIEFHSQALHHHCHGILTAADYRVRVIRHPHYPPGSQLWFNHGWLRATRANR